jgi:hypothetical protein
MSMVIPPDTGVDEACNDGVSLQRLCGLSSKEVTPRHTAFVRFWKEMMTVWVQRSWFDLTFQNQSRGRQYTTHLNGEAYPAGFGIGALATPCTVVNGNLHRQCG